MIILSSIQVLFISFIPIDWFHKLLHTSESIHIFALTKLIFLNATDSNEMSQISCLQLSFFSAVETGFSSIFIQMVILYMLTVMPVIFDICEIAALHFKFIRISDHFKYKCIVLLPNLQYIISTQQLTHPLYFINYLAMNNIRQLRFDHFKPDLLICKPNQCTCQ